jgi:hypothetical protein
MIKMMQREMVEGAVIMHRGMVVVALQPILVRAQHMV